MDLDVDPFDFVGPHWRKMDAEILRIRNDFRDHEQSYKAYAAAQSQRQSMEAHLEQIKLLVGTEGGQIQTHLKALQDTLKSQSASLNLMIKSIPPWARKPAGASDLADKVFSIPELLERILLYLTAGDLLRVQRVNHLFFDAIEASPRIQMRMGLRAQENCHIRFPIGPAEAYAFCFSVESYYGFSNFNRQNIADDEVTMKADVYVSDRTPLPTPGERCRKMLICQPPIKDLKIHTRCCCPSWPYSRSNGRPVETLHVESGVRIGDLLDAYKKTLEAHRLCPDAEVECHDDDGFVKPRVSFEANIRTTANDPKLLERQRYDKKRREEEDRWRARDQRMQPYIAAKRSARDNQLPIPTLAEYEKARDEAAGLETAAAAEPAQP